MKIRDLMNVMEEIAPTETAEPWDNVGLLVGNPENDLRKVLLTVDVTPKVIEEAIQVGANCILSHHPLLFYGTKTVRADDYEGSLITSLIQNNIALYAAHTNLDRADGGVADALADKLNQIVTAKTPYMRVGSVRKQTVGDLLLTIKEFFNPQAMLYGDVNRVISSIATASGAGGEFAKEAAQMGAKVLVTGEIKHHERLEANSLGLDVILIGHEESENPVLVPLQKRLVKAGIPAVVTKM